MHFDWDPSKAAINLQRHGISFEEASEVFADPNAVDEYDTEHSLDEDRYYIIGLSSRRLLFVVYTEPDENVVRIITARKAEGKYQSIYEQAN